jgi:hypothetical protein
MTSHLRGAFRRAAIVTAVCTALAALPAAAGASSIAFVKDGNVWLTSPDGSVQRRLTTDGTATTRYAWPSQADDGTVLAKYGDLFVRIRRDGTRIGDPIPAVGSDIRHSGGMTVMAGPADPRISPDGTRFAYWISVRNLVSCPIFDPGCSYDDTDYTIVSRVDRFTAPEEYKSVRSYRDPSWIGNDRLLVFNYGLGVKEGAISPVGAGEPGLAQWFDPPSGVPQIGQGQLTRQGDKLVTLGGDEAFGPAQRMLFLYGVSGAYPTAPEFRCYVAQGAPPSGKFLTPSWSPDGTAVAVTESDGIHLFEHIPDLRAPDADCGAITDRLLVDGSSPGWGPADVGGATPQAPSETPAAAGGDRPAAAAPGRHAVRLRVRVARAGSTVRIGLLAGRARVGSAVRRHVRAGRMTITVPLNRRGRTALARHGRLAVRARISVGAPGARPVTTTRRLTVL